MNRHDDSDDDLDRDLPDASDLDDDDAEQTVACPFCGKAVYEQAEACNFCGHYLSSEDLSRSTMPLWVVIGVIVCLAVVIGLWLR